MRLTKLPRPRSLRGLSGAKDLHGYAWTPPQVARSRDGRPEVADAHPPHKFHAGRWLRTRRWRGLCLRCFSDDVPVVLDVMGQVPCLDGSESRALQVLPRLFLAPHRAQALTALCQRHRHAVHARRGVQECRKRMVDIVVNVARSPDVLHHVHAVGLQGLMDSVKNAVRAGLVMDSITGSTEVELLRCRGFIEVTQITDNKLGIFPLPLCRLGAAERHRFLREVAPDDLAPWE